MTILERVRVALDGCKFSYSNEKQLQTQIQRVFERLPLPRRREVDLGGGDVIDFIVGFGQNLGIEVKTKEPVKKVLRQLERYAQHPEITDLLLITSVPAHSKLPRTLNGKPVHIYGLWGKF